MGKGDQKSKRGKIVAGSYGKKRPKKASRPVVVKVEKTEKKPAAAKETKPKAAAKPKVEKVSKADAEIKETKPKATKAKKTEE